MNPRFRWQPTTRGALKKVHRKSEFKISLLCFKKLRYIHSFPSIPVPPTYETYLLKPLLLKRNISNWWSVLLTCMRLLILHNWLWCRHCQYSSSWIAFLNFWFYFKLKYKSCSHSYGSGWSFDTCICCVLYKLG